MLDQLLPILKRNSSDEANARLEEFLERQDSDFNQRQLYFAFSGATRQFPKTPLKVTEEDRKNLDAKLPGFTIETWTCDQLARTLLLLVLAEQPHEVYSESITALLDTADMREATAIYAAFPLLPYPEELVPFARDGLRSNIVDIFDAIALRNPFPAAHFDEEGWNQMVLKCLFINRPLWLVEQLDERANPTLAEALHNLAHERWAAGRYVSPELWRPCQSQLTDAIVEDIKRVAKSDEPGQKEAAALILHASKDARLEDLRPALESQLNRIEKGDLTWASLGQDLEKQS